MFSNDTSELGIVVGVDGSPSATTAAQWAAHEAALRNIALTLVHVVQSPIAAPRATAQ